MFQIRKSRTAFAVSTVAALLGLLVIKAAYVGGRIQLFTSSLTFGCYVIGFILLVLGLSFGLYAKSKLVLIVGVPLIVIMCAALNEIDSIELVFYLRKNDLAAEVARSSQPDPKFIVFTFAQAFAFPAGGTWEYFIFDATDEMGRPENKRSKAWSKLHAGYATPLSSQCEDVVRHLEGHFFYLEQHC